MNRKERRAALKRGEIRSSRAETGGEIDIFVLADMMASAHEHHMRGQPQYAQDLCNQILARHPSHVDALNLLGLIYQASGRHILAAKTLAKAVASDELNAACHYNIATSYLALGHQEKAALHFKRAIALGMSQKNIEDFILQNPAIVAAVNLIEEKWPLPIATGELFGSAGIEAVANDLFLRSALASTVIRGVAIERWLTQLRAKLLDFAEREVREPLKFDDATIGFFCALAQQCFNNEYIFEQSSEETAHVQALCELLECNLENGRAISSILLAAVAAYVPLHSLSAAPALLQRQWSPVVTDLLRQQVREPMEEMHDRAAIPILTNVEDTVSVQIMQQYAENPYPRWIVDPSASSEDGGDIWPIDDQPAPAEILVAGCGTGRHACQVAKRFPDARVLAVDVSLPSLAYARRKTREAGLHNITYAQADLLNLTTIDRSFDRIEAVGVLHHLAEPTAGWRALLQLLRPKGHMRVGLYSEAGRLGIVEARKLIAERGYCATAEDIRKCRKDIQREDEQDPRWKRITTSADFYSMSGCRDLLFNIMEHRFTIPEIMQFFREQCLSFLGFELAPQVADMFKRQFPGAGALTNLEYWHAFETTHPAAFRYMYVFTVRKD